MAKSQGRFLAELLGSDGKVEKAKSDAGIYAGANVTIAADGTLTTTTLPLAGGALTGAVTTNSTFDGRDVATDGTKLDGVEASATADQSDAEIRAAVEAATDSNVFTDADHSKLNAIEASATADQTGAQIKALYEAETNAYTDTLNTKLNAIEASADVTDTTNVTAAGALMDSELTSIASVKALNQGVATTDSPTFNDLTTTGQITVSGNWAKIAGTSPYLDLDETDDTYTTRIRTSSGNLNIQSYDGTTTTNRLSISHSDGVVSIPATLAVTGEITANGGIALGDNDIATFGDSDDLQIYHDGNSAWFDNQEAVTKDTQIKVADGGYISLKAGNDQMIQAAGNSNVSLYYDGAPKLATTSTGIGVTGSVSATTNMVIGNGTHNELPLSFNSSSQDFSIGANGNFFMIAGHLSDLDSNQFLTVSNAGNVNIPNGGLMVGSTTAPAYPLEVAGTTSTSIAYQRTGVSAKKWGFHTDNDNTYWQNITDNVLALTIKNNGNVGIGTTSPTTAKLDVAGTALVENAKLKAIAASNTDTAVDVFVYDTRKDSDGGAWRKRTQNTSWYNEALNTSTRGARKEFPSVAVIVLETNKTVIYDGDDPDMPMWMTFINAGGGSAVMLGELSNKCVTMLNGIIAVGSAPYDLYVVNFIKDNGGQYSNNAAISGYYKGNISQRNVTTTGYNVGTLPNIIHRTINDVAMTVLPNAPIDADTGLPVPTIAVATNGGISLINDSGVVVNYTNTQDSSTFNFCDNVFFRGDGAMVWQADSTGNSAAERFTRVVHVPRKSGTFIETSVAGSSALDEFYAPNQYAGDLRYIQTPTGVLASSRHGKAGLAAGQAQGLNIISPNRDTPTEGLINYITSDYNTGWMHGDIKLATLSDTSTTNVTGGTQPDRSYNNNALNVAGTVTKTAVATGADLVGYSGFSASNYLTQPNNSDFEFGTGDWSMMGWITQVSGGNSTQHPIQLGLTSGSSSEISIIRQTSSSPTILGFRVRGDSGSYAAYPVGGLISANVWTHFVLTKSGSQLLWYINGELIHSTTSSTVGNIGFSSSDVLRIGHGASTVTGDEMKLALLRISATAPTEEQIAKMYRDEKPLFQENAKATLYGASNAVTALAYDDDTELLHVGTSAGRSEFQGLNRVNNTTDAVGAAISASNGFIVED